MTADDEGDEVAEDGLEGLFDGEPRFAGSVFGRAAAIALKEKRPEDDGVEGDLGLPLMSPGIM